MITHCLASIAIVAVAQGQLSWGVRLLGSVETVRGARGVPRPPVMQGFYEQSLASARAGLGEEAFAALWAQGRAMTPEQALAARDEVRTAKPPTLARAPTAPRPSDPDGLTEREVEVLRLVAVILPMVLQRGELEGKVSSPYFWACGALAALMGKHGFAEKLH